LYLGLDLGTTNVKAVVVSRDGRIGSRSIAPVPLRHTPDGGVVQDIEEIWSATLDALGRLDRSEMSAVEAVGVSAQGGAIQFLGEEGRPLGRVISWLDGRGRPYDLRLTGRLGRRWFIEHTGHGASGVTIGQVLRVRESDPALLEPPSSLGYVGDVIVGRLCGRRAHDPTSLSIAMLYNPSLKRADPEVLRLLGLEESRLPALLPACRPAGGLLPEVAARAGLRPGIPVSPAIHDQYAASLGSGAVSPGDVMLGAGTAWVLLAVQETPGDRQLPESFLCSHPVEGLFGRMLSMANGGSAFDWALRVTGLGALGAAQVEERLRGAGPGAAGLRFLPFMVPGGGAGLKRAPSAALLGLRLEHEPRHVLRAVLEGLALECGRCLSLLRSVAIPPRRIVMCGGGAVSAVTPQLVADVSGLPVEAVTEHHVGAVGAAAVARVLAEPDTPLADAARRMAVARRAFRPGPDAPAYQAMLEEHVAAVTSSSGAVPPGGR